MGKGNYYSMVMVLAVLAAVASMANCQVFRISSATVATRTGLTCSNPSPFFGRPALSGANVTVTCNGATNSTTTTTDAAGQFSVTINFSPPVFPISLLTGCRVVVTVPANCTIFTLSGQRVITLRTGVLIRDFFSSIFRPTIFAGFA